MGQNGFGVTVYEGSQQLMSEYTRRRRFTFFFADFSVLAATILCCVLIRRSCSLVLGGDTRFTRPNAVLALRRPGRAALTGGGSAMVAPASSGGVSGFAIGAVGCSGLTGTNLGSIWRSQTGHHARLSSISCLSDTSRRPARRG